MATQRLEVEGIREDTERGLTDNPKWLSSLYFYDEPGSKLFEQITQTPEYYLTRTEKQILETNADEIVAAAGENLLLAEIGSGSSAKSRVVIEALLRKQGPSRYMPVDISEDFLDTVVDWLRDIFTDLTVDPLAREYLEGLEEIGAAEAQQRLVMFLGSSLGNFDRKEQLDLLKAAKKALQPGDALLIGTDMVKDVAVMEAAYNDSEGLTAQFNLNILAHLDARLGGTNDLTAFDHEAFWNAEEQRIEMHLRANRMTFLTYPDADVAAKLDEGESIQTENSYKFTPEWVEELANKSGLTLEKTWTDEQGWFGLHLMRI